MKKINSILTLLLTLSLSAFSQTNDVATLSKGRYIEVFENDTLQRIGSVMFNTVSNKIEYFIEESDSVVKQSKESSRWMSMDPLAAQQPGWSPYKAFLDNPIIYKDPDGRKEYLVINIINKDNGKSSTLIIVKSDKDFSRKNLTTFGAPFSPATYYSWHDKATHLTLTIEEGVTTTSTETKYGPEKGWTMVDSESIFDLEYGTFEGEGGTVPGGYELITREPGESPTKYKTIGDAPQADITDLLTGLGKISPNPDEIATSTRAANDLKDIVEDATKAISVFSQPSEEKRNKAEGKKNIDDTTNYKCIGCGAEGTKKELENGHDIEKK